MLIYLCDIDLSVQNGYVNKVIGQCEALAHVAQTVVLVGRANTRVVKMRIERRGATPRYSGSRSSKSANIASKMLLRWRLFVAAIRLVVFKPVEAIYIRRFIPVTPSILLLVLLLRLFGAYCIYEYPTFPYRAENRDLPPLFRIFDFCFAPVVNRAVNLLAIVPAHENERPEKRFVEISNGINPKNYPSANDLSTGALSMIFVGYARNYHGVDRVITGLSEWAEYHDDETHLHVVGSGLETDRLRRLTERVGVTTRVTFYDEVLGEDLNRIYDIANLAIGSIGLHRTGFSQAAPLKTIEYLTRGLPCVVSYRDHRVPSEAVMNIPPDDSPLNIEDAIRFRQACSLSTTQIRELATERFSWNSAMQPVIHKLFALPSRRGANS